LIRLGEHSIHLDAKVDTRGWETFSSEIQARVADFRPWFTEVLVPAFREMEKKVYDTEGGYSGHAAEWAVDYSDRYAEWKEQWYGHLNKEHLEEKLFGALTEGGEGSFLIMEPDLFVIGADPVSERTGYNYAAAQQLGAPAANVPPRPPLAGFDEGPPGLMESLEDSLLAWMLLGEVIPGEV